MILELRLLLPIGIFLFIDRLEKIYCPTGSAPIILNFDKEKQTLIVATNTKVTRVLPDLSELEQNFATRDSERCLVCTNC